jgi:HK97 family phage major capsid protein
VPFGDRLATMRSEADAEARSIAALATSEGRAMTTEEDGQHRDAQARSERLGRQHAAYTAERDRLVREQTAAQGAGAGLPIRTTRHEAVYRGQQGVSYFADVANERNDRGAADRLARHRALVTDLAGQLAERATDSAAIAGAYPTQYMPDLYVPDLTYTGPLGGFFASTPISSAVPIVVPAFDLATSTGDTAKQATENAALANVDTHTKPISITPVALGGETIVSRQVVDGASPGADQIIGARLRELLMRDTEREIATVLQALPTWYTIADTAGTGQAQSGRDVERALRIASARFYAQRFLPAEGSFLNTTDYENLAAGEDSTGRPLLPAVGPMNASGTFGPGFTGAVVGSVPVAQAWAITDPKLSYMARRNDARQWQSAVLDVRLMEREGPQSIVFAVWQYFAFAVLEPLGVRELSYTNVLKSGEGEPEAASGRKSASR